MSTVSQIIDAVKHLSEAQKGEFLDRLAEVNFEDAWDRQIERDAVAGRLDKAWDEALKARCTDSGSARTTSTNA